LRAAAEHFRAAVEVAPDYARAWGGLADAYAVLGFYDYLPPRVAFPQAREAAQNALDIGPDNADAEATLGYVALYFDWDIPRAERHFVRSIQLRPESSKAHQWYGNLLTAAGRFDEAEASLRRATQLDPLSLIASAALGWTRYYAGHYDEALEQYELTLDLDENFELVYMWIGWLYEVQGDYDRAVAALEDARERSGGTGITTASLARTLALAGTPERSESLLSALENSDGYVPAYEIAKARFALGQNDAAMQWLERAYDERSHSLVFLRVDPQLADVQDLEAFAALADRVMP
jgi:tetratricopeptide (TPR) repeat protein